MDASQPDAEAPRRVAPGLVVGVVLLAGLLAVAGHLADGKELLAIARRASPIWLLLALALQLLTYLTEAVVWSRALRKGDANRPLFELYELSIVALFTNQVFPTAGLAGQVLVVRAFEARQVPRPAAVGAVLVDIVGYYAAYGMAVAVAVGLLGAHDRLSWPIIGSSAALVLLGFGLAGGALWIATPGRQLPGVLARIKPLRKAAETLSAADPAVVRDAPLLFQAFALRFGNFALDALTLWACLEAVGQTGHPGPAISAFMLGSLARTLGIVPGGLGTFEAATVGGLALFGVHLEPALTATLLFRGFSFWLPMIPGLWLGPHIAKGTGGTP
jgi:uncharacterized membrane protein YbhN (UPF0104 family)